MDAAKHALREARDSDGAERAHAEEEKRKISKKLAAGEKVVLSNGLVNGVHHDSSEGDGDVIMG